MANRDLTKEELRDACTTLGRQNGGVTFSNSGGFSNIMSSCTKESPDGTSSPDGKKRARLTIALYKVEAIPEKRRVSIAHPMSSTRRYTARMRFETRANALIKSPRISEVVPTQKSAKIARESSDGAKLARRGGING